MQYYSKNQFCEDCDSLILREYGTTCRVCKSPVTLPKLSSRIIERIYKQNSKEIHIHSKGAKIDQLCENCGSEQMYYKAMQTRSADEGQTIFYTCDCGHKFKINS